MGKIGVLAQNDQVRLKNGQKWAKMVKNGEIRLKMAISVAGCPRAQKQFPTHPLHAGFIIRPRGGIFKGRTRGFYTFFDHF